MDGSRVHIGLWSAAVEADEMATSVQDYLTRLPGPPTRFVTAVENGRGRVLDVVIPMLASPPAVAVLRELVLGVLPDLAVFGLDSADTSALANGWVNLDACSPGPRRAFERLRDQRILTHLGPGLWWSSDETFLLDRHAELSAPAPALVAAVYAAWTARTRA